MGDFVTDVLSGNLVALTILFVVVSPVAWLVCWLVALSRKPRPQTPPASVVAPTVGASTPTVVADGRMIERPTFTKPPRARGSARAPLIAAVAVAFLVVVIVTGAVTLATDKTKRSAEFEGAKADAVAECAADDPAEPGEALAASCRVLDMRWSTGEFDHRYEVPDYPAAGAMLVIAAAALIAGVTIAGILLATASPPSRMAASSAVQWTAPLADTASVRANGDVASALRQLRDLHADGLLTEAEYEQKRRALADQL